MPIKNKKIRNTLIVIGLLWLVIYLIPKALGYTPVAMRMFINIIQDGSVDKVRTYMAIFHTDPNMVFYDNLYRNGTFALEDSRNPLNIAIESGDLKVYAYLVERGAIIDNIDTRINAVKFLGCEMNRVLLSMDLAEEYGQSIRMSTDFLLSCFGDCFYKNESRLYEYMTRIEEKIVIEKQPALFTANPCLMNTDVLDFVIDRGFSICNAGQRNLAILAGQTNTSVIEYLLKAGCDPNERTAIYESPAIMRAIVTNSILEVSRLLLEAGANPNLQDSDGCTPLEYLDYLYMKQINLRVLTTETWQERRQLLLDYGAVEYLSKQELQDLYER